MSDPQEEGSQDSHNEDSVKKALADCLSDIETVGSFALFESLKNVPNPGIVINGDTPIGLPLSHNDALTVVAACHAAPFGRGTETIVDLQVRRTWELSVGEFRTANPDWSKYVGKILSKIGEGMGLTAAGKSIEAQLYKLLLYGEGSMFKPHQDSEKAPGMFGTLVICLPSKHEGGEVHLNHGGRKKVFETSKYSEFDHSYMAWFSDVMHEVKPVISGRRLVLTYNLIQKTPGQVLTASASSRELNRLKRIFSWCQKHQSPQIMAYMFDHHYTEASLSFNSLKGKDLQVARHLKEATAEHGMFFCLANVTRTVSGACGGGGYGYYDDEESDEEEFHTIEDELESEISLVYVADLDGAEIGRDMPLEETDIVPEDVFADLDPDDEEYEGHTGNAGAQATHFYHRTVALLMPRSRRIPFILQSNKSGSFKGNPALIKWLDSLDKALIWKPESSEQTKQEIRETCGFVLKKAQEMMKHPDSPLYSDAILARVFKAIVDLEDKALMAEAYVALLNKLHLPEFHSAALVFSELHLEELLSRASPVLSEIDSFSIRWAIIEKILENCSSASQSGASQKEFAETWALQEVKKLMSSTDPSSKRDAESIYKILARFQDQVLDLVHTAVGKRVNYASMFLTFLNILVGENSSLPNKISHPLFSAMMVEFNKTCTLTWMGKFLQMMSRHQSVQMRSEFSDLMCHCRSLNLMPELDQLVTKLCDATANLEVSKIHLVIPPFLKDLVNALQKHAIIIAASPFRTLFQNVLNTYIQRYVMPEPKADDWSRKEIVCGIHNCSFCPKVNTFLRSPLTKELRLSIPRKRDQDHVFRALQAKAECNVDRPRRDHNMVIKKRPKSGPHLEWQKRFDYVKKQIQDLGPKPILRSLLEECYDFISTLSAVRRIVPSALGRSQPASVRGPTSGTASASATAARPQSLLSTVHNNMLNVGLPQLPSWISSGLINLRHTYPDDLFEGRMRYVYRNITYNTFHEPLPPGAPIPANYEPFYIESIKCVDCGEDCGAGPGQTLNGFEGHLKLKAHRDRVAMRLGKNTIIADIQGYGSGSGSLTAADQVAPLPANRKRPSSMIDLTCDSD